MMSGHQERIVSVTQRQWALVDTLGIWHQYYRPKTVGRSGALI